MTKFASLLEPRVGVSAGEQQRRAEEMLPVLLSQSHLHHWKPGDAGSKNGRRVLVGVATYSEPDLILLDKLNDVACNSSALPRLDIFNILACRTVEDFDKYVPGIGKPFQSPVVGFWEDGVLKEKAWGKAGRDLLARALSLPL